MADSDFGKKDDACFHLGLLPIPFIGNVRKASVFILMLNASLSHGDYYGEGRVEQFRAALVRNLRQENGGDDYPFFSLNPEFAWHPGFGYWQSRLHGVAEAIVERSAASYQQALRQLAQRLACLELIPYHSRKLGAWVRPNHLPSAKAMVEFVHESLLPRVQNGEATIIAARGAKYWDLPKDDNIVVYQGAETRSAYLSLAHPGGQAIVRRLGL